MININKPVEKIFQVLGVVVALQLPQSAYSQNERLNFKSCPIVRDTNTVPCWLAEYEGELYYLGIQTDISAEFHPPYLGHQVIVEGALKDTPRICGGLVLDPVVISPVAEMDRNCDTQLPAEDQYQIDFNPRPPGPSGGRLAFDGVRPPLSSRSDSPPAPPQEFTVHYYFDGKVEGRNSGDLARIFRYAKAVDATEITITGYSGSILLSDGQRLEEREGLAKQRADEVKKLLVEAGVDADIIEVISMDSIDGDGVEDWRSRKTEVVVNR